MSHGIWFRTSYIHPLDMLAGEALVKYLAVLTGSFLFGIWEIPDG